MRKILKAGIFALAITSMSTMTAFAYPNWKQEESGVWKCYYDDGTLTKSDWAKSGDTWYWLDENGNIAKDTIIEDDGKKYYLDASGVLVANIWINDEGTYYYAGSDGAFLTSTTTSDGYYVDENGKWDGNGSKATSDMYSQDVVALTKEKAKEIVSKAISTSKELLSVNNKLKYCSTVDESIKEIKATDSKIQMVSRDCNELMSMMEPYVELNEALSLLSQAKDSLPENSGNVNYSTIISWFNSLNASLSYYSDFLTELNNCVKDMLGS